MKFPYRLLAASFVALGLFPCAVDTSPEFTPTRRPEKFSTAFVRGELGIIPASLSARYKLIAWRYLSGLPLHPDEQASIVLNPTAGNGSNGGPEVWSRARKSLGMPDQYFLNTAKSSRLQPGVYYDNCLGDAFTIAAKTLAERQKAYADPVMLRAWLTAQDQVFQNCSSDKPVYPPDPSPSLTPLARADRRYQIAAAHFYAEHLEGAEQRFRAIAADEGSPWRDTADY
jgi:hypothetical protein